MNDLPVDHVNLVVYSGDHMRLEYNGPPLDVLRASDAPRVVVVFPPFDYPFEPQAGGWGSRSFAKRAIAHICVFHRAEDWHQNNDFFEAMRACRDFLGADIDITAYGFSMGGYGAFLGAKTLGADRAVALTPQYSIDPKQVPFERRYGPQWAALQRWMHSLETQMDDDEITYTVMFDPLHNQDRKHEALFPKPAGYTRCLMHGVGHAPIQAMVEMGIQDVFFDLLIAQTTPATLRIRFRERRASGFRYLRKVGSRLHEKNHPKARHFFDLAQSNGFRRLVKKWSPYYERG